MLVTRRKAAFRLGRLRFSAWEARAKKAVTFRGVSHTWNDPSAVRGPETPQNSRLMQGKCQESAGWKARPKRLNGHLWLLFVLCLPEDFSEILQERQLVLIGIFHEVFPYAPLFEIGNFLQNLYSLRSDLQSF